MHCGTIPGHALVHLDPSHLPLLERLTSRLTLIANAMSIHSALLEEAEVISAIYSTLTMKIDHVDKRRAVASLHLPSLDFSFSLSFPSAYPAEPPSIDGIDPLISGTTLEGKRATATLHKAQNESFTPRLPCLFDLIDRFNSVYQSLLDHDQDFSPITTQRPDQERLLHQVKIQRIDLAAEQELVSCTACLDEGPKADMGKLVCGHRYCGDCLQRLSNPIESNLRILTHKHRRIRELIQITHAIRLLRK